MPNPWAGKRHPRELKHLKMKNFCEMSEQMTLQILSRSPPKSLMRFKCVRKSWYNLISNPSFVAKHLSNSINNNVYTRLLLKRLVVKDANIDEKETVFSLLNICNDNNDVEHDNHYVVEDMTKGQLIGIKKSLESAWIVGHCDGIICLDDGSNVIMLLNPATMAFKLIASEPCVQDETLNLGFGYDSTSNSYKVINIPPLREEIYGNFHLMFHPQTVKVYTSGTDSWRPITSDSLETETTNFCPGFFQLYFKGFCYWTGCEQLKEFVSVYDHSEEEYVRQVIISFDMGVEVFHYILFPDSAYVSSSCWNDMSLIVWNESVALFGMDYSIVDAESWGLWVMDDISGVMGPWAKQFTFGHAVGIDAPLQFWTTDEILVVSEEGHIISYNLDTEKLSYLPFHLTNLNPECFQFVDYMSSIVAI